MIGWSPIDILACQTAGLTPCFAGLTFDGLCAGRCLSRDMMGDMHEQLSGVDILVNNAGIQYVSAVHEFPEDKW